MTYLGVVMIVTAIVMQTRGDKSNLPYVLFFAGFIGMAVDHFSSAVP
jgi:hypothetical protein